MTRKEVIKEGFLELTQEYKDVFKPLYIIFYPLVDYAFNVKEVIAKAKELGLILNESDIQPFLIDLKFLSKIIPLNKLNKPYKEFFDPELFEYSYINHVILNDKNSKEYKSEDWIRDLIKLKETEELYSDEIKSITIDYNCDNQSVFHFVENKKRVYKNKSDLYGKAVKMHGENHRKIKSKSIEFKPKTYTISSPNIIEFIISRNKNIFTLIEFVRKLNLEPLKPETISSIIKENLYYHVNLVKDGIIKYHKTPFTNTSYLMLYAISRVCYLSSLKIHRPVLNEEEFYNDTIYSRNIDYSNNYPNYLYKQLSESLVVSILKKV